MYLRVYYLQGWILVLMLYLEGIRRPAGLGDDVAHRHEPRQHQRPIDQRRHGDHLCNQIQ